MKPDSRLADKLDGKDFIITAEYLPLAGTDASFVEACTKYFGNRLTAVNVADNHYGVAMSSLAVSVALTGRVLSRSTSWSPGTGTALPSSPTSLGQPFWV